MTSPSLIVAVLGGVGIDAIPKRQGQGVRIIGRRQAARFHVVLLFELKPVFAVEAILNAYQIVGELLVVCRQAARAVWRSPSGAMGWVLSILLTSAKAASV